MPVIVPYGDRRIDEENRFKEPAASRREVGYPATVAEPPAISSPW